MTALTSAQRADLRAARRAKIAATRAELVERFPCCFAPKGAAKRPLARGITRVLIQRCPDISASKIRAAVRDYAGGPSYLRNMIEGAQRFDQDGVACGTVDADAAALAAGHLRSVEARIIAQRARRRAMADATESVARAA